MYVNKYKDKYRAFETYKVGDKWKKVSVVMDRDTPQARRKAAAALAEKIAAPAAGVRYSELVKDYMTYQNAVMKESTYIRNKATLERLTKVFGDPLIKKMNAGFIQARLLEHTANPGTYNEYLKRLKGLFHWAFRNDYIPDSSCVDKIQPLKDSTAAEKVANKYLETEELKAVIKEASEYYAPIYEFLALSGLRIGELIALENADVTATDIIVNKTYMVRAGKVSTPKTVTSTRLVHIQPELRSCINKIRLNSRLYSLYNGVRPPYFAVSRLGRHLSYDSLNREFKAICERVAGKPLTIHALRHTHVALMAQSGVDLDTIARRLGHSNSKITRAVYYHCTEKQREKDAAVFDAVRIFG